ncbi:NUDIX domain-containing protein [Streptomyces sp. NPDC055632]
MSITDERYGALRTAAAVWAGASVLIADRYSRILIERVGYRDTCLLPGGAVDRGESPAHAAARELREELGVTMTVDRGLAVDWVSAAGVDARPALRFPGEILHVFDGGAWSAEQIAAIRPRTGEIEAVEFVEPARLPDLMSPDNARHALSSALRSAPASTPPAPPCCRTACRSPPPSWTGPASCAPPAPGTTSPSVRARPRSTLPCARSGDGCSHRTAEFGKPLLLGHLTDPDKPPHVRLRYAAALTRLGLPPVDPATGRTHLRILTTPEQALELFDRGEAVTDQLAALHKARARLGIARAVRRPVTEPGTTSSPSSNPRPTP